ncbi:MAG: large conductance mechanosensitive channel protein MscL [Chloroflexi bacterium]|nr:large conductance mechanosensitive channel protein MscL [Chloroflexi bacterium CFX1]MCQ3951698.1 large conductance mechanosensitive channel protein MscL [Chloroflexota bacterium]MDL1917889.1 large conductance mechanosensitive channel protein MscL [Chloroflexi bacterium CFX5]NUQ57915.1 large conductance mechanosensitive channel protein MscL [Anaerolineales bacterium]RIK54811.1 MAG: large conductance mechanosensitive channel protein MscL [Chloroflexota bacterium]
MFKEFKEFVMRGNVLDLAVGVIIGGAFGKIVGSLVNDILMPLIGLLMGGINFGELSVTVGAAQIKWGLFVQSIIDFLIIAFVIFLIVKSANRMKKAPPPADPTTKDCPHCFSVISIKAARCPNCTSELTI